MTLTLRVRTPLGLLVDRQVDAILAEDRSGWFGIHPGRSDLLAILPPGLMTFRVGDEETFVAVAGGLLDLRAGECRVIVRDALLSQDLAAIGARVTELLAQRRQRSDQQTAIVSVLVKEALRRMAAELRS